MATLNSSTKEKYGVSLQEFEQSIPLRMRAATASSAATAVYTNKFKRVVQMENHHTLCRCEGGGWTVSWENWTPQSPTPHDGETCVQFADKVEVRRQPGEARTLVVPLPGSEQENGPQCFLYDSGDVATVDKAGNQTAISQHKAVHMLVDGSSIQLLADGALLEVAADGTEVSTAPDGRFLLYSTSAALPRTRTPWARPSPPSPTVTEVR